MIRNYIYSSATSTVERGNFLKKKTGLNIQNIVTSLSLSLKISTYNWSEVAVQEQQSAFLLTLVPSLITPSITGFFCSWVLDMHSLLSLDLDQMVCLKNICRNFFQKNSYNLRETKYVNELQIIYSLSIESKKSQICNTTMQVCTNSHIYQFLKL